MSTDQILLQVTLCCWMLFLVQKSTRSILPNFEYCQNSNVYCIFRTCSNIDLLCFVLGLLFLSIDRIDKTRWSCPWNNDQNCTQNSARGWWGSRGWVGGGWVLGPGVGGWEGG